MATRDSTKFLILTSYRSGSTWLVDMINNLEGASAYSELFLHAVDKLQPQQTAFTLSQATQAYLSHTIHDYPHFHYAEDVGGRIRPFTVFNYLDKFYSQPGTVGFKLMYEQLLPYPEIWLYVMRRGTAVIHLVRENHLDVVLSNAVRRATKVTHSVAGEAEPRPVQVELDPEATIKKMRALRRNINLAHRLLRLTHVRHIKVTYENLRRDPANFTPIWQFLAIEQPVVMPASRLKKLVRSGYPELISNYEEVRQAMLHSEFAALIEPPPDMAQSHPPHVKNT